jgi:hypothetical protein
MHAIVFLKDKINADPYLDCKCYKRGDVIDFMPVGSDWRNYPGIVAKVQSGDWLVVELPELTQAEAASMLAPEPGDAKSDRMLQRRCFKLDLDAIPKALPDAQKLEALPLSKAEVLAVLTSKPKRVDPAVIGPANDNVIGPK